jgi:hypothetical protein
MFRSAYFFLYKRLTGFAGLISLSSLPVRNICCFKIKYIYRNQPLICGVHNNSQLHNHSVIILLFYHIRREGVCL